jgi:hypothetical protein
LDDAMTEAEWSRCTDPTAMLQFLRCKASDRKLRLFLCEGYRRLPASQLPGNTRKAALVIEQYADGLVSKKLLLNARSQAWDCVTRFWEQSCSRRASQPPEDRAHHACLAAIAQGTNTSVDGLFDLAVPSLLDVIGESAWAADCLRDIFGNPFRPVPLAPAWLAWNDGTLGQLAAAIYEQRAFDRLPVLADALEEAGCDNPEMLTHCREPGPHVRGCWLVDLLLQRA